MRAELRRQWLDALRSGTIAQTTKKLEDADGSMCCLGVLCSIAIPERRTIIDGRIGYTEVGSITEFVTTVLPDDLADEIGTANAGEIAGLSMIYDAEEQRETSVCLASCNDSGLTFAQIADIIEYGIPEDSE